MRNRLAHEEQGFGVFDGLRGAAYHHHVPLFEHSVLPGVASDDPITAHGTDRGPRAVSSAILRPTAQACGGRMTLWSSSRKAWLSSRWGASAARKYWRNML